MNLSIDGVKLWKEDIGKKVTFIPIDKKEVSAMWLEGTIESFNEYYVFVNVSGELKTFFANNLKWGHLKSKVALLNLTDI